MGIIAFSVYIIITLEEHRRKKKRIKKIKVRINLHLGNSILNEWKVNELERLSPIRRGKIMKVYYDKSTNGEILFFIGALICLIVSCGLNEWFNVLFAVGWIPILLIVICFLDEKNTI